MTTTTPPTHQIQVRLRIADKRRIEAFLRAQPGSTESILRQALQPYLERPDAPPGPTAGGALGCRWCTVDVPVELFERVSALCDSDEELLERHVVAALERAWKVPRRR